MYLSFLLTLCVTFTACQEQKKDERHSGTGGHSTTETVKHEEKKTEVVPMPMAPKEEMPKLEETKKDEGTKVEIKMPEAPKSGDMMPQAEVPQVKIDEMPSMPGADEKKKEMSSAMPPSATGTEFNWGE